jgi:hypothetical protein
MTDQTPAETLRAAAQHVREMAQQATPGPWVANGAGVGTDYTDNEPDLIVAVDAFDPNDAAWMALMHPGLAEPLAAWLESVAALQFGDVPLPDSPIVDHALAAARALLGRGA